MEGRSKIEKNDMTERNMQQIAERRVGKSMKK